MKAVIFDIETTGLPMKRNASVLESKYWPYIVQISWLVFDMEKNRVEKVCDYIIKLPQKIFIPPSATRIHGIDRKISNEKGIDIKKALQYFANDVTRSNFLVAHNIEFDNSIISVEYNRNNMIDRMARFRGKKICTMKMGNKLCKMRHIHPMTGKVVSKYPKLLELHEFLFKTTPKNLHNSLIDVYICFRCFYKLSTKRDFVKINPVFSRRLKKISLM